MCEMYSDFTLRLENAIVRLQSYIEQEAYRGYDPYDVLMSPLFKMPVLRSNKAVRFIAQQAFRRIPINLRSLLGIPKGYNPVTLGLCIQAYTYLARVWTSRSQRYGESIDLLEDELVRLQSRGYHGICWGYDFDWEGRYARIPAFMPTVVATGIITNALFEHHVLSGSLRSLDICKSAVDFVRYDLRKTFSQDGFCYSYSPVDNQQVFNASMKGGRLLAQIYSVTREKALYQEAAEAVRFVLKHQQPNGAWAYAFGDARSWSDGYHTGYVLDCLHAYRQSTEDDSVDEALHRGFLYYKENFFERSVVPKYYNTSTFPIDATCAAQAILTLTRFGELERAIAVCEWVMQKLFDKRGFVYYQKHRFYTHRTSYMRWSNAWMFCAWAYLLYRLQVV
jgi:hypothetical protein